MTSARELQASAWAAECDHDIETLLDHFHPEATFHPAGGPPQQGHAAIRAMTEDFYRSFPELSIDIIRDWDRGDSSAAIEFRAHLLDAQGAKSTLDGLIVVEVEDGKFTSVRYYEDAPVPTV